MLIKRRFRLAASFVFVSAVAACGGGGSSDPSNVAPQAQDVRVDLAEDAALTVELSASDADGDPLTYSITMAPEHGSLTGSGIQRTYTPAANFHGTDRLVFEVSDGEFMASGEVEFVVTPVNDAPVATASAAMLQEDGEAELQLTASDVDGDALTYELVQLPAHGMLTGVGAMRKYNPVENYSGLDTAVFKVSDGTATAEAAVTITVEPVNDAPVTQDQAIAVDFFDGVPLVLSAVDVDQDALTYRLLSAPVLGSVSGTPPDLVYQASRSGVDRIVYEARDGSGAVATAEIVLTVALPNGRVQLGAIGGAAVQLYRYPDLDGVIVTTSTSGGSSLERIGYFTVTPDLLDEDALYLAVASGGQDYDANADGVLDDRPTPNLGRLHAVLPGSAFMEGVVHLTAVSEIGYHRATYLMAADYAQTVIRSELDARASLIVAADIDGSGETDAIDLLRWSPQLGAATLRFDEAQLASLTTGLRQNNARLADFLALSDPILGSAILADQPRVLGAWDGHAATLGQDSQGVWRVRVYQVSSDGLAIEPVADHALEQSPGSPVFDGACLYYRNGDTVYSLNLASPLTPKMDSEALFQPRLGGLARAGSRLYAADYTAGVHVLRVDAACALAVESSPPPDTVPRGLLSGAIAVTEDGTVLLGGTGQYMSWDMTMAAPKEAVTLPVKDAVRELATVAGHVFAWGDAGISEVLTLSNGQRHSRLLLEYQGPLLRHEGLLWVQKGDSMAALQAPPDGFAVEAGLVRAGLLGGGPAVDFALADDTAFWLASGVLSAVDSAARLPTYLGKTPLAENVSDIEISGGQIYAGTPNGIGVFASSAVPGQIGHVTLGEFGLGRIGVDGGLAGWSYVQLEVEGESLLGVAFADVSNAASPQPLSTIVMGSIPRDMVIAGAQAYVIASADGSEQPAYVSRISLENPSSPVEVWRSTIEPSQARPSSVELDSGYLFVGDAHFGLRIYEAGSLDLAAAREVQDISLDGQDITKPWPFDVDVQAGVAWLAAGSDVYAYDVRTPSSPTLLGSFKPPAYSIRFLPAGDIGYAFAGGGLVVSDITAPAGVESLYALDAHVYDAVLHGGRLLTRSGYGLGSLPAVVRRVP